MFNIADPGTGNPIKDDFRNFLYVIWKHLGLPNPTPVQYDFAYNLQHGNLRQVLEAYRGAGKSWITSAFVLWLLLNDPDLSVLVVSASKGRSDDFTTFTLRLILEVPMLQHLIPKRNQRQSKVSFDVGPSSAKHAPSVKSVGITGQLAGSRADVIIADDVEVPNNSLTQTMRDKLSEAIKEFDAILKPGDQSRIFYLGTPQTEMSIYNLLPERGYSVKVWPARVPTEDKLDKYEGRLAEFIYKMIEDGAEAGTPVDPLRFDDLDLMAREASYGRSGFALQFMLDTSLSDAERYPLKLSDLIIMDVDTDTAPTNLVWGSGKDQVIEDLPNVGFTGDRFHSPIFISESWTPYDGALLTIDPSGRGGDETGYAITKMLHGRIYLVEAGGLRGGYDKTTLQTLANIAAKHKVNEVLIESNFGDGMFSELFRPVLKKVWSCTVDEVRHHTMKEARIIDTLEPVMNQHKLVVNRSLISEDYQSTADYATERAAHYQLLHQLTRITNERGALVHDDRLEAVYMGVAYWVERVGVDEEQLKEDFKEQELMAELEKFMENNLGAAHSEPSWVPRH